MIFSNAMAASINWHYFSVLNKAGILSLLLSLPALAAEPSPPIGQIVGQKTFAEASSFYNMPAASQVPTWFTTNFPSNPKFVKQYADTGLWCFAMFDVVPGSTNDVINMAIAIDGNVGLIQALGAPAAYTGGSPYLITFSFGYIFGSIPAGSHQITVKMASDRGYPAVFHSTVANLQCLEIVLPPAQP